MHKFFYSRLAISNIKQNAKIYLPYILTCIGTAAMFYIMCAMSINKGLDGMLGSNTARFLMQMGTQITAIFGAIFLLYTNSFLMKRRKKELGVYNVLGMEKRHIAKILTLESAFIAFVGIVGGLICGILLNKLALLGLLKILKIPAAFGFEMPIIAILITAIVFAVIFVAVLVSTLAQVYFAKPIELLSGGDVGEREPKTKWFLTIIGILSLGGGYYISLSAKNPLAALGMFFFAVVLVMIGTYCLFTAGSIAWLKMLRKNKNYYYKTRHFISISGLMYRMKQNAIGIANICILSTAVLIMISSTLALYLGSEDSLQKNYPRDITIATHEATEDTYLTVTGAVRDAAANNGVTVTDEISYRASVFGTVQEGDLFKIGETDDNSALSLLIFIPLDDYNAATRQLKTLGENEVLLCASEVEYSGSQFKVFDYDFAIKEKIEPFDFPGLRERDVLNEIFVVVRDISVVDEINASQLALYENANIRTQLMYGANFSGSGEQSLTVGDEVLDILVQKEVIFSEFDMREDERRDMTAVYGGLLFLGILLGLLFVMATVLLIYYKQISEGNDDKMRFEIMQKVGMSHSEVKGAIHSQVVTVFFLPLITAGIHCAFAFPVVLRLLSILRLSNTWLFVMCLAGTFAAFAAMYVAVYMITARAYYKIVSRKI